MSSLSDRLRELEILNAITEALSSAADVRQALTPTLALVAELLGLRTGWVWLLDTETRQFYSAAVHNLPPYLREPVRMTGDYCWCIGAFREGELTPKNVDVMVCSRLAPAVAAGLVDATEGLRYHASIPLYFQNKPLGIMNVTSATGRKLRRGELRLLATIAAQLGTALERARLAEESVRLARAEERTRLAREIHDTLAQGLTAIALHVEGALNHLDRDPVRSRERLERALATARESLEEARRSVLNLRAVPLDGKPLSEALNALARSFTSETGIRVHVLASGAHALSPWCEAELYRIAQEALTNVRRHAYAREVEIALRLGPRTATLAVHDDGQGFDRKRPAPQGHGLVGMRERAKLLGARLRVVSRRGSGTTVSLTVPLEEDRD